MKKLAVVMCLSLVFTLAASAADTVSGTLMDVGCAKKHMGDMSKSGEHAKSCAMQCGAKSGFGLLTSDGKFLKFDDEGNKKALDYLKNSKSDSLKVSVTGDVKEETIKVESLKEAGM